MTNSLLKWHLARDNQVKLHKFCEKHKVKSNATPNVYEFGGKRYWHNQYHFDNDSYITVELLHGDEQSYSIADCFQVVDYKWGTR